MGQINRIRCKGCCTAWEVMVGSGRMQSEWEYVYHYFSEEDREKIESWLEQGERFSFELQPGCCESCKKIVSRPKLYIRRTGETYLGLCAECESRLKDSSIEDMECPVCKKKQWTEHILGLWD